MSRRLYAKLLAATVLLGSAAAEAAATTRLDSCSWDRPGHNPFMGDVVAAVDRYGDIPAEVRERLRARMAERRYDDLVTIRRDSIEGAHAYSPAIRDMHFGEASVCARTSRSGWTAAMRERGLVYCESGHCILVPTVCRNVSRIERLPPRQVAEAPPAGGGAGAPEGGGELLFDPPGAGEGSPESFEERVASPPPGLGEGMTPLSGPAAPWPRWGDEPPSWIGSGAGPGGFGDPFGGREPIGGLPPVLMPVPWLQSPPGGAGGPDMPPLTPVPEPGTWALMLAGLALVGAAARRRRKA